MLKKTFCHIQGISENTENLLWKNGITSWDYFLDNFEKLDCLPQKKLEKIKNEINFSQDKLRENNINFFRDNLTSKQHYRLAEYGKIGYIDIETTGLSKYTDDLTVIGIYDGETPFLYINGQNLEEAKQKIEEFDILVSFNGKCFDLPFLEHKFDCKFDCIHLDLRYMLKEFGLAGGLKKIEIELGITRGDEVQGVDGFEAVRLWRRYIKNNDQNALHTLLEYNKEDIINLKDLLEYYLKEKNKLNKTLSEPTSN